VWPAAADCARRFKLSDPPEPGDVQELLGIKGEGSFVISAKVAMPLAY
jgi:hypothetical protein